MINNNFYNHKISTGNTVRASPPSQWHLRSTQIAHAVDFLITHHGFFVSDAFKHLDWDMVCNFHLHHMNPLIMITIADSNLVAYLLHILSTINQFLLTSKNSTRGVPIPFSSTGQGSYATLETSLLWLERFTTLNLSLWDENLTWMFCILYANNLWITVTITCVRIYGTSGQNEFSIEIMILFYYWKKKKKKLFNKF